MAKAGLSFHHTNEPTAARPRQGLPSITQTSQPRHGQDRAFPQQRKQTNRSTAKAGLSLQNANKTDRSTAKAPGLSAKTQPNRPQHGQGRAFPQSHKQTSRGTAKAGLSLNNANKQTAAKAGLSLNHTNKPTAAWSRPGFS